MNGRDICEVPDLMPARKSGCYDGGSRIGVPDCGEQPALANLPGNFEVLPAVSEGARHAAASRIGIYDFRARNAREQRPGNRQPGPSTSDDSGHAAESAVSTGPNSR